jgi:hypothetical protein
MQLHADALDVSARQRVVDQCQRQQRRGPQILADLVGHRRYRPVARIGRIARRRPGRRSAPRVPRQHRVERIDRQRLEHHFHRTGLRAAATVFVRGMRGHRDHRHLRTLFAQTIREREAVEFGHAEIGQHHVERLRENARIASMPFDTSVASQCSASSWSRSKARLAG